MQNSAIRKEKGTEEQIAEVTSSIFWLRSASLDMLLMNKLLMDIFM